MRKHVRWCQAEHDFQRFETEFLTTSSQFGATMPPQAQQDATAIVQASLKTPVGDEETLTARSHASQRSESLSSDSLDS